MSTLEAAGSLLDRFRQRGVPDSWECVDCGMDTAPGCTNAQQMLEAFGRGEGAQQRFDDRSEFYQLKKAVWATAAKKDVAGVLCIGCIEKRLGRKLRPHDFDPNNDLNRVPGSERLISRRMGI